MASSPGQSAKNDFITLTSSPSSSSNDSEKNDLRLWIGNLDPKLTEGYAFVTFKTKEGAQRCLDNLNGKRVLDRTMSVRWAHNATLAYMDEDDKLRKKLPALGMNLKSETSGTDQPLSKERAISAIEAKLKAMEQEKDLNSNFNLTNGSKSQNSISSASQVVQNYPYASKSSTSYHHYDSHSRIRSKPYTRRDRGRRRF